MVSSDTTESIVEAAAGSVSSRSAEAFEALANDIRVAILLALWDAYVPHADENTVSFSTLYDQIDVSDSARFNYHLKKLTGQFVSQTDDGYRLAPTGYRVIQAVIAGTMSEDPTVEPTDVDISCPSCGSPTAIGYEDEYIYHVCTECDGRLGSLDDRRKFSTSNREIGGLLALHQFDPVGVSDRTPREMYEASLVKTYSTILQAVAGVCRSCSGRVESSLAVCDDHTPTETAVCPNCTRRYQTRALYTCTACKEVSGVPPAVVLGTHPAVVSFYYAHGIGIGDLTTPESIRQTRRLLQEAQTEVISDEPPRIRITITHDDDRLALTVDEAVEVLDVTRA